MSAVLEYRGVSYAIGGRAVLRGVSLSVAEAETVVLLGRSGSGKTTLLKLANGLATPAAGEVRFENRPVDARDAVLQRRRMGYVIQEGGLFPHWTVAANIGLVPRLNGSPPEKIASRVDDLLQLVGLPPADFRSRYPRQLSGGQKQRVGIARALAADPPLLLLDEPFAALDPITRHQLQQEFLALRRKLGKAALFVTHDVREALALATRIALLKDGAVELLATPAEFLAAANDEARAFVETR
jgi:osmoprotectant transport system ATP-binding protein